MEIYRGIQQLTTSVVRPVVTIGNFDGLHLGHQHIVRLAVDKAKSLNGTSIAYTFRPHPQVALRPGANVQLLSTYDEKLQLLEELGVDIVIEEPFSREFSTVAPEQFFSDVLLRRLSAQAIVVGYDFAFGKERQGHLEVLKKMCENAGVELQIVPPQRVASEVASSSRIRQHLLSGEIGEANALLGRPFSYHGIVIKGEGRGRKIGFPTANLKLENKLALPYGVYATWAIVGGTSRYKSVTNVGVRPTFFEADPELPALVETHLLDTSQDLYGMTLEVQFVEKLREERKFDGVKSLIQQIQLDVISARDRLH